MKEQKLQLVQQVLYVAPALVEVRAERLTPVAVMFDAADTVATAPRLTVVPEITAESVKAVKPENQQHLHQM